MNFTFNKSNGSLTLNVGDTDIFFIWTKPWTQLMHGKSPWRGGWEKCHVPMQILIEVLTKHEAVMLDVYASACDILILSIVNVDFLFKLLIISSSTDGL